jgi:hypothetical protein
MFDKVRNLLGAYDSGKICEFTLSVYLMLEAPTEDDYKKLSELRIFDEDYYDSLLNEAYICRGRLE